MKASRMKSHNIGKVKDQTWSIKMYYCAHITGDISLALRVICLVLMDNSSLAMCCILHFSVFSLNINRQSQEIDRALVDMT